MKEHNLAIDERTHYAYQLFCKRWTLLIVTVLLQGTQTFNGLTHIIHGISDRLLSERLKELEHAGILERHIQDGWPIHVSYTLTEKGYALEPLVKEIHNWCHTQLRTEEEP